jgi:hypothetical protein
MRPWVLKGSDIDSPNERRLPCAVAKREHAAGSDHMKRSFSSTSQYRLAKPEGKTLRVVRGFVGLTVAFRTTRATCCERALPE